MRQKLIVLVVGRVAEELLKFLCVFVFVLSALLLLSASGCATQGVRNVTTRGVTTVNNTRVLGGMFSDERQEFGNLDALGDCVHAYERQAQNGGSRVMNPYGTCVNFVEFGMPHPTYWFGLGYNYYGAPGAPVRW